MSDSVERAAATYPLLLVSRYRRAAAPVIWAWGTRPGDGILHVAMLYVSAQLDDRAYPLHDVDNPARIPLITARLPAELVELSRDKCVLHTSLTTEAPS